MAPADRQRIEITSIEQLRSWLDRHHGQEDGVWLVTYKKHRPELSVGRGEVLDELIAHGRTDGALKRIDDDRVMQAVSPRRSHIWARTYKERARRLLDEGRMHPAGLAAIEHAKAEGTWDEHDHVDDLLVPDDLAAAFAAAPGSTDSFSSFPPSHRRNVLRWLAKAKRAETREKRIAEIARRAARGERIAGL
ncbi:MAG: YdeI/OmpD-associated family protein [Actinomycetota bacterium]